MPIKKHVCKIKENNVLEIPKTIADAIGIGEGTVVKCFSNNDGYSFRVEVTPTFETVKMLEDYRTVNQELREKIKQLEEEYNKLRENK